MDFTQLKALPFGLVLFAGMAWAFFRRRMRHQHAHHDYPALAERLGLQYKPPRVERRIGQLCGTWRGFSVLVDPDEQRKVIVRFHGEPAIDLRTYEGPRRPGHLDYYSFNDRDADRFFKTRFASPEMAERLDQADVASLMEPFAQRYRRELRQLNITQQGVTCVVDFGNPPHIPAQAVEELLSALVQWAELIEPPSSGDP